MVLSATLGGLKKALGAVCLVSCVLVASLVLYSNEQLSVDNGALPWTANADEDVREHNTNVINFTKKLQTSAQLRIGSDVILLAYMRTGSTYLGEVLSWNKDVFYWLEPLRHQRGWNYLRGRDLLCHYLKPLCEIISDQDPRSSEHALSLISDIFACKIEEHIDTITEINYDLLLTAPSWLPYVNCFKSTGMTKQHPTCVSKLIQSCKESRHRLVKVLRMDLERTSDLLDMNPRLKIVQLFRDPRGSINSHLNTDWYTSKINSMQNFENDVMVMCSRMRNDILVATKLTERYPGRVKIVQYEDLDGTDDTYRKLMEFVDFDVEKMISRGNKSLAGYGHRKPGFHPFSYRDQLKWETVKILNKYCSDVYKMLGLRMFNSEIELKNMSVSAVIDKLPFRIHTDN